MRVIADKAAIDAARNMNGVVNLHRLLAFACAGRHVLLPNPADAFNEWLDTLDGLTRSAYQRALELSARAAPALAHNVATIRIEAAATLSWNDPVSVLSLEDALTTLGQPLGIFVENADNDWHFLRGIMGSSDREKLQRAVENNWVEPLHGGGATLVQRIENRALHPGPKLRTFVIFDSDRRHPDELHPAWAPVAPVSCQGFLTEAAAAAVAAGRFWRLSRRSIESYMPARELSSHAEENGNIGRPVAEAYLRMPRVSQWYFNMKRGFSDDNSQENVGRCKTLYDGVSPGDKDLLKNGFGRKLAERYKGTQDREFDWDADARAEASVAVSNLMRLI